MSFIFLLNNTRLSFPPINNDVNYYPSKRKHDVNYGANVCAKKSMCMLKESNTWVQEMGIGNCWQSFEFRLSKNFGHGRNHRISRNFGRNSF